MAVNEAIMVTADEYRAMPETGPRYQLIEGVLIMSPAPNRYHQDISRNLEFILLKYLEKHRIGKIYHAPFDVYLTKYNVFQPDILFVSNQRLSILTDAGAAGAPNLVIEILSPRTADIDKDSKPKIYAREGVEELWILDPDIKTVSVFRLQTQPSQPVAIYGNQEKFNSVYFPGLSLKMEAIFQE